MTTNRKFRVGIWLAAMLIVSAVFVSAVSAMEVVKIDVTPGKEIIKRSRSQRKHK